MSRLLTVTVEREALRSIIPALASLPMSFRQVPVGGDVAVVSGSAGWPGRAAEAVGAGAAGVLVTDPQPSRDLSEVRAELARVPVVLDRPWVHAPAVQQAASRLGELAGRHSLLELRVDAPLDADGDLVLLAQLGLVRAALAPVVRLAVARRDGRGHELLAELPSGARVALSLVLSDALEPAARLRLVEAESAVSVLVPSGTSALPAQCLIDDEDASALLATAWESSGRAALRLLHEHALWARPIGEVAAFAEDVALLASLA